MARGILLIKDASGQVRQLQVDSEAGVYTPWSLPSVGGEPVSDSNPLPSTVVNTQFIPTLTVPVPATLASMATYNSTLISALGCKALAVGVTMSQTGVMTVQRYIDQVGLVAIGGTQTQVITAATPAWIALNDGIPFLTWEITIENTGGSQANLTNFAALLSAN